MKRNGMFTAIIAAYIAAFFLCFSPVQAQEKKVEHEGTALTNMQILQEKIKADKKLIVASNMNLTETEAKAFWPVYDEFQNQLMKNNERVGDLIFEYAMNYESMTDETAQKLLNELLLVEKERLELKEQYVPKFQKVLPAVKVARYYQIENKIQAVIRYELAEDIPLMR